MGMSFAYSIDLRERVLSHVRDGGTVKDASSVFKVSPGTVRNWLLRAKETGSAAAYKTGAKGKRKIDYDKLKAHLDERPDATLHEMAKAFGVWPSAIEKALKKMGITRKKKRRHTLRPTTKSERNS